MCTFCVQYKKINQWTVYVIKEAKKATQKNLKRKIIKKTQR